MEQSVLKARLLVKLPFSRKPPLPLFLISLAVSVMLGVVFAHEVALPRALSFLMDPVASSPAMVVGVFELELKLILVCVILFATPVLMIFLWILCRTKQR